MKEVLKKMKGAFLKNAEEEVEVVTVNIEKEEKKVKQTRKDETEVKKANKPSEEELNFARLEAEVENRRRDKIQAAEKEAEKELKELESIKEREELENKLRKEVEEEIYREEFKKNYREELLRKRADKKNENAETSSTEPAKKEIIATEATPTEEDNKNAAQTEEVKVEKRPSPVIPPSKKTAKDEANEKDLFILTNGKVMRKSSLDNKLKKLGNKKAKVNYSVITKFKVVIAGKKFFIINGELDKNAKAGRFFSPIAKDFLHEAQVDILKEIDPEDASNYVQVEGIYAIMSEGGFEKEIEIEN